MKIHQLRNATFILHVGEHKLLIDPMLGQVGSFGGFKFFGGGRKPNPLVPLPPSARDALEAVTGAVITHCQRDHLDHLDNAGIEFLKRKDTPVWSVADDFGYLRKKGLEPKEFVDGSLGMKVEAIKARHGHGIKGWLLGPGHGWFMAHPDEPSIFITGDTVLVDSVKNAIIALKPDVIVAPAGSANFGFGQDILFPQTELIDLVKMAPGKVVFNHLEALDHCPTTRAGLDAYLADHGVREQCCIPDDGEIIEF